MTERTALGQAILTHWKTNNPQMVKELQKTGSLTKTLLQAQNQAADMIYDLTMIEKLDYQTAWEMTLQEWALPQSCKRRSYPT